MALLPSASATQSKVKSVSKAIRLPSGDQSGCSCPTGAAPATAEVAPLGVSTRTRPSYWNTRGEAGACDGTAEPDAEAVVAAGAPSWVDEPAEQPARAAPATARRHAATRRPSS